MAQEKIDSNGRNTWGLYNETTGLIEDAVVDPILDALLIFGVTPDANTPTSVDRAKIDGNGRNTLSAFNEDTNGVESLRCGTEGELLIVMA